MQVSEARRWIVQPHRVLEEPENWDGPPKIILLEMYTKKKKVGGLGSGSDGRRKKYI